MIQRNTTALLYLWDRRTVFVDRLDAPIRLSQAAANLSVTLGPAMHVNLPKERISFRCNSLLLPAGQTVEVDTGDAVVMSCYLDPFGEDYAALFGRTRQQFGKVGVHLENQSSFQTCCRLIQQPETAAAEAYRMLDDLIGRSSGGAAVDHRMRRILELIKREVSENTPAEVLADEVGLSVPRLMQLFKQQVGVPIRRYRQWHRLFVTATGVSRGLSLTDAALAAGFSDSSHFHHAFCNILGMKPSAVLSRWPDIRLYAPASSEQDISTGNSLNRNTGI
jgi:AraC-like DNA-binding protein